MNRVVRIVGLFILVAEVARGQVAQVVLQDDFNDGVRNTAVWKASRFYDGLFLEQNGRLCFSCPSGIGMAQWTSKYGYRLLAGDVLVFEAVVNAGSLLSTGPSNLLEIGLGFRDRFLNPTKSCLVYLARTATGLSVVAEGQGVGSNYRSFVIPRGYARYILTLLYSTGTGKISVSYRSVGSSFGVVIGTVPLNKWWGIPIGEPAPLTPVLAAQAYGLPVGYAAKAFLDGAVVTIIAP